MKFFLVALQATALPSTPAALTDIETDLEILAAHVPEAKLVESKAKAGYVLSCSTAINHLEEVEKSNVCWIEAIKKLANGGAPTEANCGSRRRSLLESETPEEPAHTLVQVVGAASAKGYWSCSDFNTKATGIEEENRKAAKQYKQLFQNAQEREAGLANPTDNDNLECGGGLKECCYLHPQPVWLRLRLGLPDADDGPQPVVWALSKRARTSATYPLPPITEGC